MTSTPIASLFSNGDAPGAVADRTETILAGRPPADPIASLRELADSLPLLDDVRAVPDGDTSELTDTERQQKDRTEKVIRTAVAAGNTAIWIIALALERAAKGQWWRRSHPTYEAYVLDLTGRSASYVRRLRSGAPLALETAARTGRVPNPGQIEETRRAQRQHGTEAAVLLFQVVSQVAEELGDQATAETLSAVRKELPPAMPETPARAQAVIERVTRRALGHPEEQDESIGFDQNSNVGVRIRTPTFEDESNIGGPSAEAAKPDDIVDAEIVPESVVALKDAVRAIAALNRAVSRETLALAAEHADPAEYAALRERLLRGAAALQKKALRAPLAYGPAPVCGVCGGRAVPNLAEAGAGPIGAYWWCPVCGTTQGERRPL